MALKPKNIRQASSIEKTAPLGPTNVAPALPVTNAADPRLFFAWLTNNTDPAELLNIGTRLLEEGRAGPALLCYQRALELKPDDEEICFNLGVVFAR
ncbi:MAG TPA: tetratricopeptide repeat protein, partial [Candidatus Limnocylindria bacterium]|nr:tetratricopeptide repeat protein [Candidatus Limnocylindria bacterium]